MWRWLIRAANWPVWYSNSANIRFQNAPGPDLAHGTNFISITVNSADIHLRNPRLAAGSFLFDVTGLTANKTILVQSSTNLTQWTSVRTNTGPDSSMTVTNAGTVGRLFYRVVQSP